MATVHSNPGETRVNVTIQTPNNMEMNQQQPSLQEKLESKTAEMKGSLPDANATLKQILSSLAETKRYLPQQVNTFLDSMEGKTIDDLRVEAMHLANKAQEEARKRTTETVETARQRAQDITGMAKARTSDLTLKGKEMVNNVVQPPIQATTEATKSMANKANERAMGLASQSWQYAQNMVLPYAKGMSASVTPYAQKAKEYLPPPAKSFVEENIEGKSPEELGKLALSKTRANLLSVKDSTKIKETPSLNQLLTELRSAAWSGDLFRNALGLTEQAANKAFGETAIPKDTSMLRRMYNLTFKVNNGVMDMTKARLAMARQTAMDMANQRLDNVKSGVWSRADSVKQTISPYLIRIGQMPVIPSFVYSLLRSEPTTTTDQGNEGVGVSAGLHMGLEGSKGKAPEGLGSKAGTSKGNTMTGLSSSSTTSSAPTTVKVQVQSGNAPQATTTTKVSDEQHATVSATAPSGDTARASTNNPNKIGNTNAQGLGALGEAGMGVTTTGGEDKEDATGSKSKGKKHQQQKL